MELDPGIHIVMHSVLSLKLGVTQLAGQLPDPSLRHRLLSQSGVLLLEEPGLVQRDPL
jgi:hypothetical protein